MPIQLPMLLNCVRIIPAFHVWHRCVVNHPEVGGCRIAGRPARYAITDDDFVGLCLRLYWFFREAYFARHAERVRNCP